MGVNLGYQSEVIILRGEGRKSLKKHQESPSSSFNFYLKDLENSTHFLNLPYFIGPIDQWFRSKGDIKGNHFILINPS